jgi:hypothetical protein
MSHRPVLFDELQRPVRGDGRRDAQDRARAGGQRHLDPVHERHVLDVDPELLGERGDQREVRLECLLEPCPLAVEAPDRDGGREDDDATCALVDRQQTQDERITEGSPPEHDRRVVGRP